jgi:PleD family two-component response regulator
VGHILYADDDDLAREVVRDVLEAAGHRVRVAEDGRQALAELSRTLPDLVLLDYRMGDPDGLTVCRTIKDSAKLGHLPVLILTGEGKIDDRLKGFEAGADDYLAKPVDSRELVARVGALLELSRRGMDRNPSSGLPGGDAIRRAYDGWQRTGEPFAVCYLDLDHFKPFGERFGFPVSDAVIHDVGSILWEATRGAESFAGHVGGDDFIVLCADDAARPLVEDAQAQLAARLPGHVPAEVVRAGRFVGRDRSGVEREFPLTRLAAAILHVRPEHPVSLRELGEMVSEVKDRAKASAAGVEEVRVPA